MYSIIVYRIIFLIIFKWNPIHSELNYNSIEYSNKPSTNQLNKIKQIDDFIFKIDTNTQLNTELNENNLKINKLINKSPFNQSNQLIRSSNLSINKSTNSSNKFLFDHHKFLSKFIQSKYNHYHKYSRRRRSSIHYTNNLSLDKKVVNKQKEEIFSHKYQPNLTPEEKNKLINKFLNNISNNANELDQKNSTNPVVYVELPPSLKVFFYCVYTLIFFVGLIGNSLNIYVVYSNKSMYNVTYIFISNLAMSDILLCLFSVPITPMYLLFYKHWPFGKLLCHLLPFSQGVSVYVSAFTLMSIAVDRYFVIIFPFKKRMSVKMCIVIIIIIWISGSTLTLPYAIFMKLIETTDEDGSPLKFCEEAWPHDASRRTFSTCTSVIQFIVPFVMEKN